MSDAAARLRALAEAATGTPWIWDTETLRGLDRNAIFRPHPGPRDTPRTLLNHEEDGELIVALRNAAGEIADLIQAAAKTTVNPSIVRSYTADLLGLPELAKALAAVEARLGEPA